MQTRIRQPYRLGVHPGGSAAASAKNDAIIDEYLEWKKTYAPRAAHAYAVWIKRFQGFANKAPEELCLGDWTAFARSLEGRFAPKSIQFGLNVIHNYLRFWLEQGRLRHFPLYLAKVPRATSCSHNAATEAEFHLMVRELEKQGDAGLRDLVIIRLLHDTGMRVGELVRIEIDQIEENMSAVIDTEKSVKQRRVFWNEQTDEVLQRWIVARVNSGATSDWLFAIDHQGEEKQLTTRSVQRMMQRVLGRAGIGRKLSPHSFRHALIHRLAALGVPDAVIAQVVGHGSPHSISHYTKLSRPEYEEVARKQFRSLAFAA